MLYGYKKELDQGCYQPKTQRLLYSYVEGDVHTEAESVGANAEEDGER